MRTYEIWIVFSNAETRLLQTTTLATFVQAVQALQLGGNTSVRYKSAANPFAQVQGFRIDIIDP